MIFGSAKLCPTTGILPTELVEVAVDKYLAFPSSSSSDFFFSTKLTRAARMFSKIFSFSFVGNFSSLWLEGKLGEELINWVLDDDEGEESNNASDSICMGGAAGSNEGYWIFEGGICELIIILEGDI